MTNEIQRITVKAIVEKDGKILLLKDLKDKWELPGGKIEFGEQPEQSLKRELEEELGLKEIVVKNIINTWSFTAEDQRTNYQFIVIVYAIKADGIINPVNKEYKELKWMNIDEINQSNIRDGYKTAISKYYRKPHSEN